MNNTQRLASIETILGGIPTFKCLEGCHDCCGPVVMTRLEWKRIIEFSGRTEKEMRQETEKRMAAGNFTCIFLDDKTGCTVYEVRPAICRIFGASESKTQHASMLCPHGAGPEKKLTHDETNSILDRVDKLGW